MTHSLKREAKRDGRLSLAILLFVTSAGSLITQAWVLLLYFRSAVDRDWEHFLEVFPSAALPPLKPGVYCFGDCYPNLPFVSGWIGIATFFMGLSLLAYSWWAPKSRDPT